MASRLSALQPLTASKPFWGIAAATTATAGIWLGTGAPHGILAYIGFAIMPDIALLAGIGPGLEKGQLHPRAVRLYNALHTLTLPVAIAIATAAFGWSHAWFAAALGWTAHIAVDRALGYGKRASNGFQRGA